MTSKIPLVGLVGILVSLVVIVISNAQEKIMSELAVVSSVDLRKYAGTWYEIARLPNSFQNDCAGDVTATYVIDDDGIEVTNRCRSNTGEIKEATGRARVASAEGPNTKLKVRFAPAWLSFLPFVWGDYWIIDLASDYSYAVVGEPSRRYFWILSRKPRLSEIILKGILDRAQLEGYDLSKLLMTNQSAAADK